MRRPHYLLFGLLAYVVALRSMTYLVPFLAGFGVRKTVDSGPAAALGEALTADLALLLGFALVHSALARPRAKRWLRRWIPEALETSFYSLVAGVQMSALLLFWSPLPTPVWQVGSAAGRGALWILFGLGWLVVIVGFATLRNGRLFGLEQAWSGARGRSFDAPELRIAGIYRYVRHPLYSGTILALWSAPVMSVGHLLLAALFTAYIFVGRRLEEADLERRHGEAWRRYRDAVPAFLPRLSAAAALSAAPGRHDLGGASER